MKIKNLEMTCVCPKSIPKLLMAEQKSLEFEIAHVNLKMVSDKEMSKKIITDKESWILVMTLKRNNTLHSGSFHSNHDRKNQVRETSNQIDYFF